MRDAHMEKMSADVSKSRSFFAAKYILRKRRFLTFLSPTSMLMISFIGTVHTFFLLRMAMIFAIFRVSPFTEYSNSTFCDLKIHHTM